MKRKSASKLSPAEAAQIAQHLVSIVNHPHMPEDFVDDILESLNDVFNDIGGTNKHKLTYGNIEYVKNLLLAASGNGNAIETGEIERQTADSTTVGELYAVIEDEDTSETLANSN